jgi:hypothetical protein
MDEPPTGKVVSNIIHALTKTSASDIPGLNLVTAVGRYQVVPAVSYLNSLTIMTGLG